MSKDNLKKPLAELEIKEVSNLLETLNLSKYKTVFREHEVDGRVLDEVESLEEVKTLGIEQPLKAKVLIRNIMKYKAEGVPIKDIRERTEVKLFYLLEVFKISFNKNSLFILVIGW